MRSSYLLWEANWFSPTGTAEVSVLQSSEAVTPIIGCSNRGIATVHSRGGVLSKEGPFSGVLMYI